MSLAEGVALFHSGDLILLGRAADLIRRRLHPEPLVTFVIDRNINYTNVCATRCRFCAFFCDETSHQAYVLSDEELFAKIAETLACGGTQLLIQGGLHPQLGLDYYLEMLQKIKSRYRVHLHSFSPPEIMHMVRQSGLTLPEVIKKLQAAGLDSIPGGGAEILDNRVRQYISPRKIRWEEWMAVMQEAHRQGMKTTATMMFGSIETVEERVAHLVRVRTAQDETGGFTAFIPWSFQPLNTTLAGSGTVNPPGEVEQSLNGSAGERFFPATGFDYLKTLAISRLMLDNVPNIQASWVTQGAKMAQVALSFGANDFGGTMLEENVVRAAGVTNRVPLTEIIRAIQGAGYRAAQRDTLYQIIKYY